VCVCAFHLSAGSRHNRLHWHHFGGAADRHCVGRRLTGHRQRQRRPNERQTCVQGAAGAVRKRDSHRPAEILRSVSVGGKLTERDTQEGTVAPPQAIECAAIDPAPSIGHCSPTEKWQNLASFCGHFWPPQASLAHAAVHCNRQTDRQTLALGCRIGLMHLHLRLEHCVQLGRLLGCSCPVGVGPFSKQCVCSAGVREPTAQAPLGGIHVQSQRGAACGLV